MNKKEDWTEMKEFGAKIAKNDWLKLCEKPEFMKYVELNNISGCMKMALKYLPKNVN